MLRPGIAKLASQIEENGRLFVGLPIWQALTVEPNDGPEGCDGRHGAAVHHATMRLRK